MAKTNNFKLNEPDPNGEVIDTILELRDNFRILDMLYPVGSIYLSTRPTSPASFMKGSTWRRLEGRFLLGANSSYPAGETGGAANRALTEAELPRHWHQLSIDNGNGTYGDIAAYTSNVGRGSGWKVVSPTGEVLGQYKNEITTRNVGNGLPFSIMPPYLSVYMWERTA